MTDMQSISATLASIDVASTFLKGYLNKTKDDAIREKVAELLNSIMPLYAQTMSLYESNLALIKKADNLETKLREIESWNEKVKEYIPYEITPRVIVYMKQSQSNDARPLLYFCPNCFNVHKQISIIQLERKTAGGDFYFCPNQSSCQFKFIIPKQHPQEPPVSPLAWT